MPGSMHAHHDRRTPRRAACGKSFRAPRRRTPASCSRRCAAARATSAGARASGRSRDSVSVDSRDGSMLMTAHTSHSTQSVATRSASSRHGDGQRRLPHQLARPGRRNSARGISRAPSEARCAVDIWQSISGTPSVRAARTRCTSATFDASLRAAEHRLAEEHPPEATPYSPPTSASSAHASTECAWPSSTRAGSTPRSSRRDPGAVLARPRLGAAVHRPAGNAVSSVTRNRPERIVLRSERETCSSRT